MTTAAAGAAAADEEPPRPMSLWMKASLAVVTLLTLSAVIWLIGSSRLIIADTDRRNQAELAATAAGLEQWSAGIATLARAHFVKDRVTALDAGERDYDEGWRYRVWLRHPVFDEFKIAYEITTPEVCEKRIKERGAAEPGLPFVDNYNGAGKFLKLIDSFPLNQIHALDTGASTAEAASDRYVDDLVGKQVQREEPLARDSVVCFVAGIPLERLLTTDAARDFSTLMVVDANRNVVAQSGARLPLRSLAGLAPEQSILARTLAASLNKPELAGRTEPKLADALEPVDLKIGSRTYVAYVRSFITSGPGFAACLQPKVTKRVLPIAVSIGGDTAATATGGTAQTAETPAVRESGECLIVGLVPRDQIWKQAVAVTPGIGVTVVLATFLLITLLPSLRLILLGPGESIGRAEAIGVALGIPAAVSLATLALLFAVDIGRHRQAAQEIAATLASQASAAARTEVGVLLRAVADLAENPGRFEGTQERLAAPQKTDELCRYGPSGLPVIDAAARVDEDGRQALRSVTLRCRGFAGGRPNVSARDFFVRLRDGGAGSIDGTLLSASKSQDYVLAHVISVQDGIAKTIAGMRTTNTKCAELDRCRQFVVASTVLPGLVAPVLPPPFGLMIVDTRPDVLPVLLHPTPGRAGTEQLAGMIRDAPRVRAKLRALVAGAATSGDATVRFEAFYDGGRRSFTAHPVLGTKWVAVVSYRVRDIDRLPVVTAVKSLQTWASFSLLFTLAWTLWLVLTRRRGWPRLWPQRAHEDDYQALAAGFAMVGLIGLLLTLIWQPFGPVVAIVGGLAVRVYAAIRLHVVLGVSNRTATPAVQGPLRPKTQRRFFVMLAPLLLCLSVVPMIGFWQEARGFGLDTRRQQIWSELRASDGALARSGAMLDRLRWTFDSPDFQSPPPPPMIGILENASEPAPATRFAAPAISRFIAAWVDGDSAPEALDCPDTGGQDAPLVNLCGPATVPALTLAPALRIGRPLSDVGMVAALALAIGLMALIVAITVRVLRSLAGFDRALGAVRYPPLYLGELWHYFDQRKAAKDHLPSDFVTLNRKSLLINAPYAVREMLAFYTRGAVSWINVAEQAPSPASVHAGTLVVVTGLELVLADRTRRLTALRLLERYCARIDAHQDDDARLIILSETAPLERILDAFERDNRAGIDAERENLRWSQLFENFATYGFRQQRLTGGPLTHAEYAALPELLRTEDNRTAIDTVLDEVRWLPHSIVNGGIGCEIPIRSEDLKLGILPLSETAHAALRKPLIAWAAARQFPGKFAVRGHLRNQFIEYYQKLWSSATHAEHLILHNMAHGRFVNIAAALAFASLVRRGLIVLDPEPRLMNESFAMFVRQAEKLDTIQRWRSDLPSGAWVRARLPLLLTICIPLLSLIGLALIAGEDILATLPVLAAGAPALLAAAQRLLRPN